MTIGMIGLGHMGGAMARRLVDKGRPVIGYDISAPAMTQFAVAGGSLAASPREVADNAEIVLACLPGKQASFDTAFGDARYRARRPGENLRRNVDARPRVDRDNRRKACGQPTSAFSMHRSAAGPRPRPSGRSRRSLPDPKPQILAVRGILELFAANVFVVGDTPGMAQVCKLVNNILSITAFVTSCEAITMGVKAGLDARTMIDVINVSTGRNSATVDKFPKAILPRTFDYGGPLTIGLKDLDLYLELARDTHMPAVMGFSVSGLFNHIATRLGAEADYSDDDQGFRGMG